MAEEVKFMVEDAEILFRNFSGEEQKFNKEGKRNFTIRLDEDIAQTLIRDGWNVKYLRPREDDEDGVPTPIIQIELGYKVKPPRVTLITSASRTSLDEGQVGILDWADIQTVDLIARNYDWEVNGKTGRKAYLQTMFVTINEDELELKYAIPEG